MGPPLDFLEGLAGFYAILAEIRNCPDVLPNVFISNQERQPLRQN